MLESGVAGPLVCSYANTAGGMESILLDLGIAVGDEPSPTFLVDVEETSRIREVLTPAVARMTREDLPGGWYMPTGRSLAPSGNPMHRSMQALIRPGGQQEAPATLFVPTKRK
jgi:hypothetical protein